LSTKDGREPLQWAGRVAAGAIDLRSKAQIEYIEARK
jgi:hypothetical protein